MMQPDEFERRFPPPDAVYGTPLRVAQSRVIDLARILDTLPDSREKSLALTRLEESDMWLERCFR